MRVESKCFGELMRVNPGDIVYDAKGRPGVVRKADPVSGKVEAERSGSEFEKARRFGFINGLDPADRSSYQQVMSEIRAIRDPEARIASFSEKLSKIEEDPAKLQLARYLRAEKSHLMFSSGVFPKSFTVDESNV